VGIPNFYGFGSGLVGGQRVRFLVLTRLGADIQKFFQSGDRPLPLATALNIAIQIIDSLGNANNTRCKQYYRFELARCNDIFTFARTLN
jgi:hypothetical protein